FAHRTRASAHGLTCRQEARAELLGAVDCVVMRDRIRGGASLLALISKNRRRRTAMKRTVLGGTLVLASLALSVPLIAHHGAASFDIDREITLKGMVAEWIWSNPHCFLKFDAKDDTGMVRTWTVETGNPTDVTRQGFQRGSFKFGDMVTVTLQPV